MIWKSVYGIIPVPVFYRDGMVPEPFAGKSYGFFIVIKPEYRDDVGLLDHELCHCEQFYRYLCVPTFLLFTFSQKFKLAMEVEAYKRQLLKSPHHLDRFAVFLVTRYGFLNLTLSDAQNLLRGGTSPLCSIDNNT